MLKLKVNESLARGITSVTLKDYIDKTLKFRTGVRIRFGELCRDGTRYFLRQEGEKDLFLCTERGLSDMVIYSNEIMDKWGALYRGLVA